MIFVPFRSCWGHSDVRTTMIYTHTVKSVTLKEARSPLDLSKKTEGSRGHLGGSGGKQNRVRRKGFKAFLEKRKPEFTGE